MVPHNDVSQRILHFLNYVSLERLPNQKLSETRIWNMVSVLCCFTELNFWHFLYSSSHWFSNTSNIVNKISSWKMLYPRCAFTEMNTCPFPYNSPHSYSNMSNLQKQELGWKTVSRQCYFTQLSICTFPIRFGLGFQTHLTWWNKRWVENRFPHFVFSQSIWSLPYISHKVFHKLVLKKDFG